MMQLIQKKLLTVVFLTVSSGTIFFGLDTKSAFAACNPFGCSQSSVAECNPFGCPNAPSGEACSPFGCPQSPQPTPPQPPSYTPYPVYPQSYPYPYPPNPYPAYPAPAYGGNPEAIAACMDKILYREEEQKPFSGWVCVANDVNCRTVRVRTEISEDAAVRACQGAR